MATELQKMLMDSETNCDILQPNLNLIVQSDTMGPNIEQWK